MGLFSDRRHPVLIAPTAEEDDGLRIRVWLLGLFTVVLFAALTVQLVRLQVFRHEEFEARATINRIRNITTPAERGLIFDRNGNPLVENVPAFAISVIPADVPDGEESRIAALLAQALGTTTFSIEAQILEGKRSIDPFFPRLLEANASQELAFELSALGASLPGVEIEASANRLYHEGQLLGHILGYVGPISLEDFAVLEADRYRISDRLGQTGVEAYYESVLRGTPGQRQFEVNSAGRELRTLRLEEPTPGNGIQLTIDLELQAAVREILLDSMGGSLFATAVVVDVRTGEILSMVSVPDYDPNIFTGEIDEVALTALLADEGRPLVNHAIADQFASGSIFKVVTGTAALSEAVIAPAEVIFSPGVIEVQNEIDPRIVYTFRDTTSGNFDFVRGLAESSNVYFWYLSGGSPFQVPVPDELLTPEDLAEQRRLEAQGVIGGSQDFLGLGVDNLSKWARQFGLDSQTGIDLVGEASGFIPTAAWKLRTFGEPWGQGDSYNFGIGQGFVSVTPLQMAMVTAAIANGGRVLEPRVVGDIVDSEGTVVEPFTPRVIRELDASAETLETVRRGMAMAVLGGTAGNAWFPEMQVAGKTGTAEFGAERLFRDLFPTHGWFLGFAPYDDPQIAMVIFHQLGSGFLTAEAGGQIMRAWGEINGVFGTVMPALGQLPVRTIEAFNAIAAQLPDGTG
ncbi:MAG: penicillin-binding protein 2 [Chloroflexi bacterium]|nr:MAG: penicillin-binding protein 2 [Chloroflexota bacterium]